MRGGAVGRTVIFVVLAVVALIVVGMVVMSVLGAILKFAFYLLIGAAVVGGGLYLAAKARRAVRSGKYRELGR